MTTSTIVLKRDVRMFHKTDWVTVSAGTEVSYRRLDLRNGKISHMVSTKIAGKTYSVTEVK